MGRRAPEVCTGLTGHAEVVRVIYDREKIDYEDLLKVFWESHDPTQGMGQHGDIGTQYRSVLYVLDSQQRAAVGTAAHRGAITTEIAQAGEFFYGEEYYQQYLAKNPDGYCGLKGTGISCPIGGTCKFRRTDEMTAEKCSLW